jgi:hypothetical protein
MAEPVLFPCAKCESTVSMLAPEAAASRFGLNVRQIFRLVESGEIHFNEESNTTLLVCLTSLLTTSAQAEPIT